MGLAAHDAVRRAGIVAEGRQTTLDADATLGIIMLTFTPLEGMSAVVLQFMPAEFRPDMGD